MATVQITQRNAHLAADVRLSYVNGRDGKLARATLVAISNEHRGSGEEREERAVSLRWTLWGKQAEHAAEYLGKGSHVNIVGRVHNSHFRDAEGAEVHTVEFTAEEIDYLDSRAEGEARRSRHAAASEPEAA